MNTGIILISSAVIIWAFLFLKGLRRETAKPKWVIKAHYFAVLFAIAWAVLNAIEEILGTSLSDTALSYLKLYDSIVFGLCLGIILTLWLSGQLIRRNDAKEKTKTNEETNSET